MDSTKKINPGAFMKAILEKKELNNEDCHASLQLARNDIFFKNVNSI